MKLTISKAALAPALAVVGRVVERRNTIPILSNIAIEADAVGSVRMRATDLDLEARMVVAARVDVAGALTVPAAMFGDIVRKAPDGDITLEDEAGGARMIVRAGRFKTTLHALPIEELPDLAAGEMSHRFEMDGPAIAEAIGAVTFAISTEETRYYLNGIFLHREEDRLKAVATDGHRLGLWQMDAPPGTEGMPGVLIPRKTVGEIAKAVGESRVAIEISDAKVRVTSGDLVLTSKLIDGTFPDYGRVIPPPNENAAIWQRDVLSAAIDRVTTVSTERGRAVKMTVDGDQTTLSVANPDAGSATEEVETEGAAKVEIGFNSRYLGDMLAAMKSASIRAEMADAGAPSRWMPTEPTATAGQALYVLMPMRVS